MSEEKISLNYVLSRVVVLLVYTAIIGIVGWSVEQFSSGTLISLLGGVPKQTLEGNILMVNKDSCPDGWEKFSDVAGKYLMASGGDVEPGDLKDVDPIILGPEHLPIHGHQIPTQTIGESTKHGAYVDSVRAFGGGDRPKGNYEDHVRKTRETGHDLDDITPIVIKPSYVAVLLCKEKEIQQE